MAFYAVSSINDLTTIIIQQLKKKIFFINSKAADFMQLKKNCLSN